MHHGFEVLLASPKGIGDYGLDHSYDVLEDLKKSWLSESYVKTTYKHKLASTYEQVKSTNRGFGAASFKPVRMLTSLDAKVVVLAFGGPCVCI